MRKFSSLFIQNEVLTITYEHTPSADHFYIKFQDRISSYDQNFEQPEEELNPFEKYSEELVNIKYFKEKYHDVLIKFSSGPIINEILTITSGHPSSEYNFERKSQDNISPYNQSFEQPE